MFFVFTCSLLAIILAYLESCEKSKHGLCMGFFLMTLLSAIRYGYGADYFGYIEDFQEACSFEWSQYFAFADIIREPAWYMLMKLFEPFGCYVFFAFLAIFSNVVYYKFIRENIDRKYYWLAMSIYLLNFDLFVLQQSMMRQGFAMALFVLAFHYINMVRNKYSIAYIEDNRHRELDRDIAEKGKFFHRRKRYSYVIKLIVVLLIMSFIHTSSIFALPAVILILFPLKKSGLIAILMTILFCGLWMSSKFVAPIFDNLTTFEAVAFYGEKYANDDGVQFGVRQILSLIPFLVSVYYLARQKDCGKKNLLVIFAMIGTLILPFAKMTQLVSRLAYYFDIFTICAYPIVYSSIHKKFIRALLLSIMLIIYVYVWFDKCSNPIWSGSFEEYKTLFSLL